MREILFRGKRIDNGEWVIGSYQADVMAMGKHTIIYADKDNFYCEDEVDPESVGQYTGLKDKNGVEIYEGDILEADDSGTFLDGKFYEGFYRYWKRRIVKDVRDCFFKNFTEKILVIGNIHDNPELLGGESDQCEKHQE